MGYDGMIYYARTFYIAQMSLPGSDGMRMIPMMVTDAYGLEDDIDAGHNG